MGVLTGGEPMSCRSIMAATGGRDLPPPTAFPPVHAEAPRRRRCHGGRSAVCEFLGGAPGS